MKRGAVDYLPKPFTPEQVRTAARRVVTANILKRQLSELRDRLDESEGKSRFETNSSSYAVFLQNGRGRRRFGCGSAAARRERHRQIHSGAVKFETKPPAGGGVRHRSLSNAFQRANVKHPVRPQKGAFTGAVADSIGKVEEAESGTLFFDEVADLSADAQARLLRF